MSEKFILACDSPTLFVNTRFDDFLSRALIPGTHYWPIRDNDKCRSIKFAVDWGNSHQKEVYNVVNIVVIPFLLMKYKKVTDIYIYIYMNRHKKLGRRQASSCKKK